LAVKTVKRARAQLLAGVKNIRSLDDLIKPQAADVEDKFAHQFSCVILMIVASKKESRTSIAAA